MFFGLPSVKALNLSSLPRNDLSTAGFSRFVTASGGLGIRGAITGLDATDAEALCKAARL